MHGKGYTIYKSHLSSGSGGLITILQREYLELYDDSNSHIIEPGRVLAVILGSDAFKMIFIHIHVHGADGSSEEKSKFSEKFVRSFRFILDTS